ncbi:MAG: 3'-5' exoribonuclease 1 [Saprospiraceae bacterium]
MNFIIYDLEATCWEYKNPGLISETIEIGALKVDNYGEILGSYNRFVKPTINPFLSPFCKKLTSISQEDVESSGDFPKVIAEFKDWIGVEEEEEYILCAWGSFDKKMLIADCLFHYLDEEWVEPYLNLKDQYQDMKKLHRPCGLKNAIKREGMEFTGIHHRGISDAENLTKIFTKYLDVWQY